MLRHVAALALSVFAAPAFGACTLDCGRYDVLRVDLSPIEVIPPDGSTLLFTSGAGGFKWPAGGEAPADTVKLTRVLIGGEPSAGTVHLSLVLGTERELFLELPAEAASAVGLVLPIAPDVVPAVEFTGGYGTDYGWWNDAWRFFADDRRARASIIDPFSEEWTALTSTGSVAVEAVAPLRLLIDVTTVQKRGPPARARGRGTFSLEDDREVCAR